MEDISDDSHADLENKAIDLLKKNLVKGQTINPPIQDYTYICPDPKRYKHQFLWDSCFHVIVNSRLNLELAKLEFETLLKRQESDGFMAHMNYWKQGFSPVDKVVKKYYKNQDTSSLTQPALVAQALRSIYEKKREKDYIINHLPNVRKFYDFLFETRILEDDDVPLLNIIHTWESGIDNSSIFDEALNIKGKALTIKWTMSLLKQLKVLKQCDWNMNKIRERDFFLYKDILFNCVFVQGYRDLGYLHEELGEHNENQFCLKRAKNLEDLIIKHLWNEDRGLFFGLYGKENAMDDVKSVTSFLPLILDGLPSKLAHIIVEEHLLNEKEFWTNYPVPSIAVDEPSYSEHKLLLWRGPTWINTNWFIVQGLRKHGFENVAIDLTIKSRELVNKGGFREFYSPKTGKGMGAKNFAWSTLVVDIEKSRFNTDLDFLLNREWTHIKKGGFG